MPIEKKNDDQISLKDIDIDKLVLWLRRKKALELVERAKNNNNMSAEDKAQVEYAAEILELAGKLRATNTNLEKLSDLFNTEIERLGSKTKLKRRLKTIGYCLSNGKIYGLNLPNILLENNRALVFPKVKAKEVPLVHCCLVETLGR